VAQQRVHQTQPRLIQVMLRERQSIRCIRRRCRGCIGAIMSVLLSEKALARDGNKLEPGGARPGAGAGARGRDVRGESYVEARMRAVLCGSEDASVHGGGSSTEMRWGRDNLPRDQCPWAQFWSRNVPQNLL
jgi:hypothetical protein